MTSDVMGPYFGVMLVPTLSKTSVTLDRLLLLCEIAEHGGIMAAAQGQATRQSQMSRQMSSLEEALGVSLLNRDQKPHQLSPHGVKIEQVIRNFSKEFETNIAQMTGQKETITIGAGESFILWFLIPLLSEKLPAELGRVRFRNLQSQQAAVAVSVGHIDLAVHHRHDLPAQVVTKPLSTHGYRLVSQKGVLEEEIVSWDKLPPLNIVALEGKGSTRKKLNELCDRYPEGPQISMECSSLPQVLEACQHGPYIAVVPETASASAGRLGLVLSKVQDFEKDQIFRSLSYKKQREESSDLMKAILKVLEPG
ncbi:LysR family transcriptional regulator [Verrucomicrobiaceae bacterium 227]